MEKCMVHLRNKQRKISFDTGLYQKKAEAILGYLGYPDFDLGILLTTNRTIRNYNRDYRNKDQATDVLSFPYHPQLQAGQKIKAKNFEDKNLGDLIIALQYVLDNKQELPGDFNARMDRMLVHGICHLLGYDHIQDNDYQKMIRLENKLLRHLATLF
jgi:probable rRNA maturation factor